MTKKTLVTVVTANRFMAETIARSIGATSEHEGYYVLKKLKSGNRDIFKSYTSHCRYKGKWHKGLYTRRCMEVTALFVP